jgi:hypothetical protein
VFIVSVAGDLEIFSRVHGLSNALRYIAERADARYPAFLVDAVQQHAVDWLHALEQGAAAEHAIAARRAARRPRRWN